MSDGGRPLGERVHLNVCPDCGTTDSGHLLDPPPLCPHKYECFVPVEFVPASELEQAREALREAADDLDKAANQFASMRESQQHGHTPDIHTNHHIFAAKAHKARQALASGAVAAGDGGRE